jgi:hypothetical protein
MARSTLILIALALLVLAVAGAVLDLTHGRRPALLGA